MKKDIKKVFKIIEKRRIRLRTISNKFDKKIKSEFQIDIAIKVLKDNLQAMDDNWQTDLDLIERYKNI